MLPLMSSYKLARERHGYAIVDHVIGRVVDLFKVTLEDILDVPVFGTSKRHFDNKGIYNGSDNNNDDDDCNTKKQPGPYRLFAKGQFIGKAHHAICHII